MTPFIRRRASESLLKPRFPERLKVITRFALGDFSSGVIDIAAL